MRRTPPTDTITSTQALGGAHRAGFDAAYHELATARAEYDAAQRDADNVPALAAAADRLADARRAMRLATAA